MSLKKSSLIILFSLLFFFVASTITSVGLIIKSNTSLDNVNKEIQVVLSIIDPITRTAEWRIVPKLLAVEPLTLKSGIAAPRSPVNNCGITERRDEDENVQINQEFNRVVKKLGLST
ncbi:hypothetical protein [Enterobacter cloacae complex sp. P37RS]|uniref:hypothetical protein n=1 Tax=unclassified Enterobacter cloacae complex TaxID=2757714 RepID=UPI001D041570|nr:hypothetical protein [Enterobacter cloacae complex sp. P37RS]